MVYDLFETLLQRLLQDVEDEDRVRIVIDHPELDIPIIVAFRLRRDVTVDVVLTQIETVLQSAEGFNLDSSLKVKVIVVRRPRGGSRLNRRHCYKLEEFLKRKHCIIQIKNDDNNCLSRALVVAKAICDYENLPNPTPRDTRRLNYIKDHRRPLQRDLAEELRE